MCHSLFQSNEFYIKNKRISVLAIPENTKIVDEATPDSTKTPLEKSQHEQKVIGSIKQLEGILSFIYKLKRPHDNSPRGRFKNPNAITKLYRKFLFYTHFFSLKRPLIICEGKTDLVYLKCALKQLEKEYGEFVEKSGDNFIFRIGFLNLTQNFKDVLAISEGTGGLASLMSIYQEYMNPFKGEGKKYPVIILIDNDSGSKNIMNKLNDKDFSKPFYFFVENLYVVRLHPEVVPRKRR